MSETVIIVGAGSSIDIAGKEFPAGPALLSKIGTLLDAPDIGQKRSGEAQLILEICSQRLGGVQKFLEVARRIVPLTRTNASIDQLITFAKDDAVSLVAKTCIGFIIGRAEATYQPELKMSWLFEFLREYLARARTLEQAVEKLSRLTFVVFNYDRIIEANIWMFLRDRFELAPEAALALLAELNIIHPYGQLGSFVLGATNQSAPVPYDRFESDFPRLAPHLVENIRTFDEAVDEAIPARIRKAVDEAKSLVLVGFGFGDENLELIAPGDNQGPTKSIYATRFNINDRRWTNLETAFVRRLSRSPDAGRLRSLESYYGRRQIQNVQTCGELVAHFSLEW